MGERRIKGKGKDGVGRPGCKPPLVVGPPQHNADLFVILTTHLVTAIYDGNDTCCKSFSVKTIEKNSQMNVYIIALV